MAPLNSTIGNEDSMATVTSRIKEVKQPRGGYLPLRNFASDDMDDLGGITSPENIHPNLIGIAVDYLSRLTTGGNPFSAFEVSLVGARLIRDEKTALSLLRRLDGLTDDSIRSACQLVGYDVVFRAGPAYYKPVQNIEPDQGTITSIRTMVGRITSFLEANPLVMDGFDLTGGYTELIDAGDGDLITKDGLWDIKVSKSEPKPKDTLQILVYWLMGRRSIHPQFQNVTRLGIINPRLGKIWTIQTDTIPTGVIKEVSTKVIGYDT